MATDETYNGWTNKPTWLVKLWIDNDQNDQEYWLEEARNAESTIALADELKDAIEESADFQFAGILSQASLFSDLFSYALASVNWYEVAAALIEDAKEIE